MLLARVGSTLETCLHDLHPAGFQASGPTFTLMTVTGPLPGSGVSLRKYGLPAVTCSSVGIRSLSSAWHDMCIVDGRTSMCPEVRPLSNHPCGDVDARHAMQQPAQESKTRRK